MLVLYATLEKVFLSDEIIENIFSYKMIENEKKYINTVIKNCFSFLKKDFGFREVSSESDNWDYHILFCNSTTGVRISYETRENDVFVMLIRLMDGKLPEYPIFIDDNTSISYFDLQDLLSIRDPNYEDDNPEATEINSEIEISLKKMAEGLKAWARDILMGDFTIFSDLEKIVRNRAK